MIDVARLYEAADIALDRDPILVLQALGAVLALADELAGNQTGRFFAEEMCNRIASALNIQEGGSGDG